MATVKKSTLFPADLATEMFNKVKGHSSLAKMAAAEPVPFNGKDIFAFNFASDVSVVGESGAKPAGDATVSAVQIRPIKVVYQSRVSDEFIYASEEEQLSYLQAFADGFSKKMGAALDKMALHGINPATGSSSSVVGNNNLDYILTNYSSGANLIESTGVIDADVESAISKVDGAEYIVNGVVLSTASRAAMAALETDSDARKYPDFAFGAVPATLGGAVLDVNTTLATNLAYVGDFEAFKWGFAKELPLEVIEYGNPDGGSYDLKQANEVLLRSEAFIGWAFLDAAAFAAVVPQGE